MRVRWMLLLTLMACRVGFEDQRTDAGDDLPPLEAGATRTETWGEDGTADHRNVTVDTYVSDNVEDGVAEDDFNFGTSTRLGLDAKTRVLFRFDTSALPAGTRVVSASLRIDLSSSQHGEVSVYRVTEAWDAGTNNGTNGAANWNDRAVGKPWSSAGIGVGSRDSSSLAEIPASASGVQELVLPRTLVETWIDDPAENFGIVMSVTTGGDETRVTSSEGTDGARPLLAITYLP